MDVSAGLFVCSFQANEIVLSLRHREMFSDMNKARSSLLLAVPSSALCCQGSFVATFFSLQLCVLQFASQFRSKLCRSLQEGKERRQTDLTGRKNSLQDADFMHRWAHTCMQCMQYP